MTGQRNQGQPDHDRQRRKHTHCGGRACPPVHQNQPGKHAADLRRERQPSRRALDEQAGIENGEQQRQRPERRRGDRAGGQKQQQPEADQQHDATAPRRLQRPEEPARNDRDAKGHEAEQRCRARPRYRAARGSGGWRTTRPETRSQRTRQCNRADRHLPRALARRSATRAPAASPSERPGIGERRIDPDKKRKHEQEQRCGVLRPRSRVVQSPAPTSG